MKEFILVFKILVAVTASIFMLLVCIVALAVGAWLVSDARERRQDKKRRFVAELSGFHKQARRERRHWLQENANVSAPLNYPDYRQLWHRELDAESRLNKLTHEHSWTSWGEYKRASDVHKSR